MLPSERKKWYHSLESATQHLSIQLANGSHRRLLDLAARMHHAVPVMDRFYHLIRYRKCLLGSEAVLWLIHDQRCSQDEAIALGNQMIDLGFLHHVTFEHFLCHAYLFYRFDLPALAESDFFQLPLSSSNSHRKSAGMHSIFFSYRHMIGIHNPRASPGKYEDMPLRRYDFRGKLTHVLSCSSLCS